MSQLLLLCSWAITAGASHFPLLFLPSPIFLLPLPCSPFSRVLLTSSFRPFALVASSHQPLPAAFMVNPQPWCSGLCSYSQLCHKLCSDLAWQFLIPGPGASQSGHAESAGAVLAVTRAEHPKVTPLSLPLSAPCSPCWQHPSLASSPPCCNKMLFVLPETMARLCSEPSALHRAQTQELSTFNLP